MAYLKSRILIYSAYETWIVLLLAKKINIPKKYANFLDVFFKKSAIILFNFLDINKYIIDMKPSKQPFNRPIYSLDIIELEILRIYIKTNLANRFIRPFKSLAKTFIFLFGSPMEVSVYI